MGSANEGGSARLRRQRVAMTLPSPGGSPMHQPRYVYDRLYRTSRSEAYLVSQGEEPVARVELHFAHTAVYGLLIVEKQFSERELSDLIGQIDRDLVETAEMPREDLIVTVYEGREIGVYSDPDDDEEDEEEDGNGAAAN